MSCGRWNVREKFTFEFRLVVGLKIFLLSKNGLIQNFSSIDIPGLEIFELGNSQISLVLFSISLYGQSHFMEVIFVTSLEVESGIGLKK